MKKQELDDDLRLLKGACTLPLAGLALCRIAMGCIWAKAVGDRRWCRSSVRWAMAVNKHLVIVTKDEGYVRKPSSKLLAEYVKNGLS